MHVLCKCPISDFCWNAQQEMCNSLTCSCSTLSQAISLFNFCIFSSVGMRLQNAGFVDFCDESRARKKERSLKKLSFCTRLKQVSTAMNDYACKTGRSAEFFFYLLCSSRYVISPQNYPIQKQTEKNWNCFFDLALKAIFFEAEKASNSEKKPKDSSQSC